MGRREEKLPVITDPLRHAENKWQKPFYEAERVSVWEPFASYCVTRQFANLDDGYVRHCGPTAITNLLLTLNRRYGFIKNPLPEEASGFTEPFQPDPADVFRTVCRIGRKNLAYWNTDVVRRFGGTYDWLTGRYIRECFRYFGIPYDSLADGIFLGIGKAARSGSLTENSRLKASAALKVTGHVGLDLRKITDELRSGKLLYLQLHWHPSYGDHHVLCYGCRILTDGEKTRQVLYLLTADGWTGAPRYVEATQLLLRHYYAIG